MMTLEESGARAAAMWERLASSIEECAHSMVIEGDVERAVRWAMFADACFYQSTGEGPAQAVTELVGKSEPAQSA